MDAVAVWLPPALGRLRFLREVEHGHWVAAVALLAIILLLIFWPRLVRWMEARRNARR